MDESKARSVGGIGGILNVQSVSPIRTNEGFFLNCPEIHS